MTAEPVSVPTRRLSDHACVLGEGPSYDAGTDSAFWFDVTERLLFEHRFESGETLAHTLPFMASHLSVIDGKRQLIASETGLHIRETATGRLHLLREIEADNPATRSNDGRVHPSGALWIGTMGKAAETGAGAIYWFHRGVLRTLFAAVSIPNAICFTADGRRAYFSDTATGTILTVETDPETGLPSGEPALFRGRNEEDGWPDGAVVDAEGLVWNARWGAGRIDAYDPTGRRVRSLRVPAGQPSCPAFVGRNADLMLVTTARQGIGDDALLADPEAGRTLLLDVPFEGRLEPRVVID